MSEPQKPWSVEDWRSVPPAAGQPVAPPHPPRPPRLGAPPKPPRRRWVLPVIIGSSVLVVALIVGVGVAAASVVTSLESGRSGKQPLEEGTPQTPVAVKPLKCTQPCFTAKSVNATLLYDMAFDALGVSDTTFPNGTYDPMTAGELYRRDATSWRSYNGSPDECFFAPTSAPYAAQLDDSQATSRDLVYFTGTHENVDRTSSVDQSLRIFASSADAEKYIAQLATSIDACTRVSIGPASQRYSAQITPAPALNLPESVAAVGWVRTGTPGQRWRGYVFEAQRGNLVITSRLLTDGGVSELRFRHFVQDVAAQLASLPPEGVVG